MRGQNRELECLQAERNAPELSFSRLLIEVCAYLFILAEYDS
jgi:hypothetical protein